MFLSHGMTGHFVLFCIRRWQYRLPGCRTNEGKRRWSQASFFPNSIISGLRATESCQCLGGNLFRCFYHIH